MSGHDIGNGLLAVDKPAQMSSARLVGIVKRCSRARKLGHTGTLDPFATGLMVLCFNQATKLAGFFLNSDKRYTATLYLGVETDTYDGTGEVTARRDPSFVTAATIAQMLPLFTGQLRQKPPVYSALKHQGTPLYKLARQGRAVQKPEREIQVRSLRLVGLDLPEVTLDVACSAGTYIRSLAADMGTCLGCGAHLTALRRTETGKFRVADMLDLETVKQLARTGRLAQRLIPMQAALPEIPEWVANKTLTDKIKYGRILFFTDIKTPAKKENRDFLKVLDTAGSLIALLEPDKKKSRWRYVHNFIAT